MRINQIINESEINEGPVGAAVGAGLGALAGGPLGAAAGAGLGHYAGNAVSRAVGGFRQGFQAGQEKVKNWAAGTTTDTSTGTRTAGSVSGASSGVGSDAGISDQQSKIGVGQINKIIPTLRMRDLQSVKKNVDAAIAAKTKAAPAGGATAPSPAPSGAPAGGTRTKGQEVDLGGRKYRWAGAQWVDTSTGKIADKATAAQLNKTPVAESKFYSKFLGTKI